MIDELFIGELVEYTIVKEFYFDSRQLSKGDELFIGRTPCGQRAVIFYMGVKIAVIELSALEVIGRYIK